MNILSPELQARVALNSLLSEKEIPLNENDLAFLRKLLIAFYSHINRIRNDLQYSQNSSAFEIEQEDAEKIHQIFKESPTLLQAFLELFQTS